MSSSLSLEIKALRLRFDTQTLELKKAPLLLRGGFVYLIDGPSGAGKSSFARAFFGLGRLRSPLIKAQGDIVLHQNVSKTETSSSLPLLKESRYHRKARKLMAFLPQADSLGFIDSLKPSANAQLFSNLSRAQNHKALKELAQKLALWPLPRTISQASGGEKMRLSAIRSLLPHIQNREQSKPALIIADEPTTGIDAETKAALIQTLFEAAEKRGALVILITHRMKDFLADEVSASLPPLQENTFRFLECEVQDDRLTSAREIGSAHMLAHPKSPGLITRGRDYLNSCFHTTGALALAPLAFFIGVFNLPRKLVPTLLKNILKAFFHPGTLLFAASTICLISLTAAISLFLLFPKRELIQPLILKDLLKGYGVVFIIMLTPLFTTIFTVTKVGAAQVAQLASSVRSGLLDTLSLAQIRPESYALVPTVLAMTLSLALTLSLACVLSLLVGAFVFSSTGSPMGLKQVATLMYSGVLDYPHWQYWLGAKVLVCGFVCGSITAFLGLQPLRSEYDIARAVHKTLLWNTFSILVIQCSFILVELNSLAQQKFW